MRNFFWTILAIAILTLSTHRACSEHTFETPACCFSQPFFELKAGYFIFSDSKMRKIYDRDGLDLQVCASYPLWNFTPKRTLYAYGAIEYFYKSGRSTNDNQKTSLWSVPISLGLKPVYALSTNLHYYLAAGPRYFYLRQHNHSSYVYENKSKNTLGFFVNTGFHYFVGNCLVIDIFGEYSEAKIHLHTGNPRVYTKNRQVGGFTVGGGLGCTF